MIKKIEERDLWQSIDYQYMTEESEREDEKGAFIMKYSLPWRSKSKSVHKIHLFKFM